MICEKIFSKRDCGVYLIFCRLRFINNFIAKKQFSGNVKSPKVKYLKANLFFKYFCTRFSRFCLYKQDRKNFPKNFFSRTWSSFFKKAKRLIWAPFFTQKIKSILLFKCEYSILAHN